MRKLSVSSYQKLKARVDELENAICNWDVELITKIKFDITLKAEMEKLKLKLSTMTDKEKAEDAEEINKTIMEHELWLYENPSPVVIPLGTPMSEWSVEEREAFDRVMLKIDNEA